LFKILGVAAARFHSIIHTQGEVYAFGINGGQMGLLQSDENVPTPKLISRLRNKTDVKKVATSDGATLCLFEDGELYLLQDFVCRKIKDIGTVNPGVVLRMTGGVLKLKGPEFCKGEPLQIAMLQSSGLVSYLFGYIIFVYGFSFYRPQRAK